MTIDELQAILPSEAAVRQALRQEETLKLLCGNFQRGRMPNIYQVTFPNGSQLRLKFYDTIKRLYNNKNVELIGRESVLSYLEVSVLPAGSKGYYFTLNVQQIVCAQKGYREKHAANLAKLLEQFIRPLGLETDLVWTTTYTENY